MEWPISDQHKLADPSLEGPKLEGLILEARTRADNGVMGNISRILLVGTAVLTEGGRYKRKR